ncbi:MAG: hypothetical protein HY920_08180 [Elusimicrobia bacterium]|nr:hypothetical protein [Elusimicrobiota bacterium]
MFIDIIVDEMVEKLVSFERDISNERGKFSLFALFLREDAIDRWDLVVSASWLNANRKESYDYLAEKLRLYLKPQEMVYLSGIFLINKDSPTLNAIHKKIQTEHKVFEISNSNFFGMQMEQAYIITSMSA